MPSVGVYAGVWRQQLWVGGLIKRILSRI
jgi:hypothetical protein